MNDEFEKQLISGLAMSPKFERSYAFKKQKFEKLFDRQPKPFFPWPKFFVPAFAAILLLLTIGSSVVIASQKSLPGEPLYPVKRAAESVKAKIMPEFKQELVVRRGEEVKQIVEKKEDPQLLQDSLRQVREQAKENRNSSKVEESIKKLEEAKKGSSKTEEDEIEKTVEEIRQSNSGSGSRRNDDDDH